MKTIKFSEKELGFIRQQYQVELEEAEEYVENLKNILSRISAPESTVSGNIVKKLARRGRPAKIQKEGKFTETGSVEKIRKQRSDKGKPRFKRNQGNIPENVVSEVKPVEEKDKPVIPKKKVKRQPRKKGVFLPSLRKPL
jgi:hypothetical protein